MLDKQEYELLLHKLNFLSKYIDTTINYENDVIVEFVGTDPETTLNLLEQLILQ